jgi:hypothetical protein
MLFWPEKILKKKRKKEKISKIFFDDLVGCSLGYHTGSFFELSFMEKNLEHLKSVWIEVKWPLLHFQQF